MTNPEKAPETKRKLLVTDSDGMFTVEIPEDAKITFGPPVPFVGDTNQRNYDGYALRIYRGSKENLLAVFPRVRAFRDLSLTVDVPDHIDDELAGHSPDPTRRRRRVLTTSGEGDTTADILHVPSASWPPPTFDRIAQDILRRDAQQFVERNLRFDGPSGTEQTGPARGVELIPPTLEQHIELHRQTLRRNMPAGPEPAPELPPEPEPEPF